MAAAILLLFSLSVLAPAARAQSVDSDLDTDPVAPGPILGPIIAPPPSSEYGRGVTPPPQPDVARPLPPPTITSPITGFGPGGMQQPPGAPLNPPYTSHPFVPGH